MRTWLLAAPLAALLAACTTDTAKISILRDDAIGVHYERPYGHHIGTVTATINGQPLDLTNLFEGREGTSWSNPEIPAMADFTAPLGSVDGDLVLELSDGNEHYTMEVPGYGTARAIHLHGPVDTLQADQWIELDTGVATDDIVANMEVRANDRYCFGAEETRHSSGVEAVRVPPTGRNVCTMDAPPPGTTIDAQLTLSVQATLPTTRCEGPNVECEPVRVDVPDLTTPTTLVY